MVPRKQNTAGLVLVDQSIQQIGQRCICTIPCADCVLHPGLAESINQDKPLLTLEKPFSEFAVDTKTSNELLPGAQIVKIQE